jgi:hypothetical protein
MLLWKELLELSGGELQLEKCFYYVLSWDFDGEGNPHPVSIEDQCKRCAKISIPNKSGIGETVIQQKGVIESHRT